jgi:hypothetical protein
MFWAPDEPKQQNVQTETNSCSGNTDHDSK